MKLVTFEHAGEWRPGVIVDDAIFDVDSLLAAGDSHGAGPVGSIRALLDHYGEGLNELADLLVPAARANPAAAVGAVGSVRLGPPVIDPQKVLCIGLNYSDHVAETGRALPSHPDIFVKFASTLIGPEDQIRATDITPNLDFEGELAIVIGRACRNVRESDALDVIAGLMVMNDITARDLQYRSTQWTAGKAVDGSTPCGPAIITLDEVGDPQTLDIRTIVNGVEMQSSNTRYMIFDLKHLIAYITSIMSLNPGDIITTGTPQGIGAKLNPPVWLNRGDVVEVELERVGTLRNVIW